MRTRSLKTTLAIRGGFLSTLKRRRSNEGNFTRKVVAPDAPLYGYLHDLDGRLVRAQKEQEGRLERAQADLKVYLRAMESRISANLKANLDELVRSYNLNIAGLVLAFAYFTGLLAFSTPPSS